MCYRRRCGDIVARGAPRPQRHARRRRGLGITSNAFGVWFPSTQSFCVLESNLRTQPLPLTLTAQVAQPAAPDAPGLPNRKIWNYHLIELESSAFPTELISLIGDIPAVVPNTLTYTPDTQTWKLTAFIYHPPITQTS